MGWDSPSRWLFTARTLQLVVAFVSTALHGFTTIWIHVKKLGMTGHLAILELLISLITVYITVALLIQHFGWRFVTMPGLTAFVVFDLFICGMLLLIIYLLARSNLPVNCVGLVRSDYRPEDTQPPEPLYLYSTIRFSDESPDKQPGMLDRFCPQERAFFWFSIALVFLFIASIVLGVIRIFEMKYIRIGNLGEEEEVNLKAIEDLEQPSPISSRARVNLPPAAPPSEGIVSRTASLRSTTTASTSRPAYSAVPFRAHTVSIPRRPVGTGGPTSPRRSRPGSLTRVSLDEDNDSAEAALVSDGIRHQHRPPPSRDNLPHQQHYPHPYGHHPHGHHRMPSLLEEDQMTTTSDMDHALVSDGMRPSAPMLPPYEPGNRRTSIGG